MANAEEQRDEVFYLFEKRLAQFAQRALNKNLLPRTFVVVCIQVDDPYWGPLVRNINLANGQDMKELEATWERERANGGAPVGVGTIMRESFEQVVTTICPSMRKAFEHPTSRQQILCLVLAFDGASAYLIQPQTEPS